MFLDTNDTNDTNTIQIHKMSRSFKIRLLKNQNGKDSFKNQMRYKIKRGLTDVEGGTK